MMDDDDEWWWLHKYGLKDGNDDRLHVGRQGLETIHYTKISKNEGGGEIINKISQNINKISQNINKISQDANFFENVKKKYYGYKIHVEQKVKK